MGAGVLTMEPHDAAADITASSNGPAVDASLSARAQKDTSADHTSRSSTRSALVSAQRTDKSTAMPVTRQSVSGGVTETVEASDPRDIAMLMLPDYGWTTDQFSCLDELYLNESGWDPLASNPTSGAHGIPQAMPGDKMAIYGSDWETNPETQLEWGLAYIEDSYGSPCGAWGFWQSNNWY